MDHVRSRRCARGAPAMLASVLATGALGACGGTTSQYAPAQGSYIAASSGGAVAVNAPMAAMGVASIQSAHGARPRGPSRPPMAAQAPRRAPEPPPPPALAPLVPHPAPHLAAAGPSPMSSPSEASPPMLLYVATVTMLVERPTETIDRAVQIVTGVGGFLASRSDATVELRIPSGQFRPILTELEHLGDVVHRQVQAEDITEHYHDLEVQLVNLRAVSARLEEFLHRATNVEQALAVERELERVGGQIDQIEGQLRFLAEHAAYSTVTLALGRRNSVDVQPFAVPDATGALPIPWLNDVHFLSLMQLR